MTRNKDYFYLLMVLIVSCTAPSMLPKDYSRETEILLPFRIDTMEIVDLRRDTTSLSMKLPAFATRKKDWIINPTFNSPLKNEIMDMIRSASNPDGLPTRVTLTIKEDYYKISGSAIKVSEHT